MKRITLTTTGRKTGKQRSVTVYAFDDHDRLVVVGSRGGSARDPAWAINLRADPHASVGRGRNAQQMVVHEAEGTSAIGSGSSSLPSSRCTSGTSVGRAGGFRCLSCSRQRRTDACVPARC
jgi:deazaflavin-dependent oxidoreductase (nitroreductase family)